MPACGRKQCLDFSGGGSAGFVFEHGLTLGCGVNESRSLGDAGFKHGHAVLFGDALLSLISKRSSGLRTIDDDNGWLLSNLGEFDRGGNRL